MQLSEYQNEAQKTDQNPGSEKEDLKALIIPLLGLAGESGSLLTEYKKHLRDGPSYRVFRERIEEELGDILWYISNIATKADLNLDEIARKNLLKVSDRFHDRNSQLSGKKLFDEGFPTSEQFPRRFEVRVETVKDNKGKPRVQLFYGEKKFGHSLTDNSYEDDGYRLHDVFHLAYVAILGWSPVLRKFFECKRKSLDDMDENEDGGRATVIDEAISALIFVEAKKLSFFENVNSVDYGILRAIKDLTAHLEVGRCSAKQWEIAILEGYRVWRLLRKHERGKVVCDLIEQKIEFILD